MTTPLSRESDRRLRLLVVIASFGEKNLEFLKKIIHRYRAMSMDVDIIVTTEATKNLGAGVRILVGLPNRNPRSLPFGHKRVFAENVDRYDLFIYSEDDIEVTEENIRAFVEVTARLEPDEIAGYIRFELDEEGEKSLPDVHGRFHWRPDSARQRGKYTIAEFTNKHSGFYILTQAQLRKAISSGGFLRPPYEAEYEMLETAATDPYTSCGFRKVICISALEEFLIHHMPNTYIGRVGLPLSSFKEQIVTLMEIWNGTHPVSILCEVESKVLQRNWYKSYYEIPNDELLSVLPEDAKTVLSVGCGWGATEAKLKQRGSKVTDLPLDSVIGAVAARRGIEVVYGTMEEGLRNLRGREFDCVLITNLLHLLPDPWAVLAACEQLVGNRGTLVISGPNFQFLPHLFKRVVRAGDYGKLRKFDQSGLHAIGIGTMKKHVEGAGFSVISVGWFNYAQPRRMLMLDHWPRRFVARNWIIGARQK